MDIQSWLQKISPELYWLFIFFSSFVENIFPPYPGDTVTVLGGYLVGRGQLSLLVMGSSVFLGSILGALVMYFFGQKVILFFTTTYRIELIAKELEKEKFEKAQDWFKKNAFLTIIFSRFSAGIRFFVSIVAGITRMNLAFFFSHLVSPPSYGTSSLFGVDIL